LAPDDGAGSEGTIAKVANTAKGVHVTFVVTKQRRMGSECVDTTQIDRIEPGGKVVYRQRCHDTGVFTMITSPDPTVVPAAYAIGVKPGRVMVFGPADDRKTSIPAQIFSDAKRKRLIVIDGFELE
jgi:hypothetical protein